MNSWERCGFMPDYDLNRIGENEFENLAQALVKKIIGVGTVTFGDGPDGGREATYSGKAPYPSQSEQWDGEWIFQAKYHNLNAIGHDAGRKQILLDLRSELEKITEKYKRDCQNYILITNVHLSSVDKKGTHDKISDEIIPDFCKKIPHIHVWGHDDICRFLELFSDIRQSYLHFITPGDILAGLMDEECCKRHLAETLRLYIRTSIDRDESAKLDQAGQIDEKPLSLRKVFIDLDLKPRNGSDLKIFLENNPKPNDKLGLFKQNNEAVSAVQLLLNSSISRVVIIGGPGQGKSTLAQFIAQIHRAYILQKNDKFNRDYPNYIPNIVRIPFRILLKDYAQWMVDNRDQAPHTLEKFISKLVRDDSGGRDISAEDVQDLLKTNPILLILDGLDEVTDSELRAQMLDQLTQFILRADDILKADLQILATSRPTGYSDQFDPSHFLHLSLVPMNRDKILEYTKRWIKAKEFDLAKGKSLESSVIECLDEPNFSSLMNTPLQVTIFIFIILHGGTPPRQREELFEDYLEIIYKRERAKSRTIIQTEKRLLLGLHQYFGYMLHKRAGASANTRSMLKEDEFKKEVFNYLRKNDPISNRDDLVQKADQLIREAHERLVLLVKLEPGFFGFELRSFQEFFAAGYLNDTALNSEQRFNRFRSTAIPPHWHNVALFFAGRVGRCHPGEAAYILEACREIDRNGPNRFLKRGAWFALDIAVDRSFEPNRMLQRSAIEYSLTLLECVVDFETQYEFHSRISELPKEDLDLHVIPLLSERLKKSHILTDFFILDIYRDFSNDLSTVEDVLDDVIKMKRYSQRETLQKALEYSLSPNYIQQRFMDIFCNLNEREIMDLISFASIRSPEYFLKLWRNLIGERQFVAISIFNMLVDGPLFFMKLEKFETLMSQRDSIGQIMAAIKIIAESLLFVAGNKISHQSDVDINEVLAIVMDTSAMVELRTASLVFVYRSDVSQFNGKNRSELLPKFMSSINSDEMKIVEWIFFLMGVPSIERLDSIPASNEFNFLNLSPLNSRS